MIGPHERRELDLMLKGLKPLAAFSDIVPQNGEIAEDIIPEKQFAPYVSTGQIKRHCEEFKSGKNTIRTVCFSLPSETWRAKSYCFLRQQIHSKSIKYTDEMDIIFGKLLGYSDEDIRDFITT